MNQNRWAQAGALVLALTMFVVVIAKAQGCQKPAEPTNTAGADEPAQTAATPQTDGDTTSSAAEDEPDDSPPDGGAADRVDVEDAGSNDAGGASATPKKDPPMRIFPATKSGAVKLLDDPQPVQQNGAGGLKRQNANPSNK